MATSSINNKRIIEKAKTTKRLIDFVFKGGMTANAIKAHFGGFCDCNVTEWLYDRIMAGDPVVVNRLLVLLRSSAMGTVETVTKTPPFGKLLDRYCDSNRLMGRVSNGDGGISIVVLSEDSNYCSQIG